MLSRLASSRLQEIRRIFRYSPQVSVRSLSTALNYHIDMPDNKPEFPWEFPKGQRDLQKDCGPKCSAQYKGRPQSVQQAGSPFSMPVYDCYCLHPCVASSSPRKARP